MIETFFLIILIAGWPLATSLFFKKTYRKDKHFQYKQNLLSDVILAVISFVFFLRFIGGGFLNGFVENSLEQYIFLITFFIIVSFMGIVPVFHEFYKKGVSFMIAYFLIGSLVFALIFDRTQIHSIINQSTALFGWFMGILLPMQVGKLIGRLLIRFNYLKVD